ncbi:MAG TPA: methyltransferase domain-containing protein [Candidatus Saccharimonadales bacterium]|nr:methyltransferase domain-containing protein [Candidatus Saccharimonadales bacterium]
MSVLAGEEQVRVLEIGYGDAPAVHQGSMFANSDVAYFGMELPRTFAGSHRNFSSKTDFEDFPHIEASMSQLPFSSGAFDYVLLRSVFSQFGSRPEIIDSVRLGVFEVVRILKDEGKLVVAEENTPLGSDYIESELRKGGLVVDHSLPMPGIWEELTGAEAWSQARSQFYNDKPWDSVNSYYGTPHLLVGRKPTGLKTMPRVRTIRTDFYRPMEERSEEAIRQVTFEVPVVQDESSSETN